MAELQIACYTRICLEGTEVSHEKPKLGQLIETWNWDFPNTEPNFYPLGRDLKPGIARAERDGTSAEARFRLSPKRTSPFKSVGASVQSTAGSGGVRISLSNAG